MRSEVTRRELLAAAGTTAVAAALPRGVLAQEGTPDEWPAFGYDAGKTGYNPDGEGPRSDVGGAWEFTRPAGPISAGSAVVGGVVYAPSEDGNLYAVDTERGEEVDGWPVELGAGSGSPPTVADGTVYVGDDSGVVHAIDAGTGEHRWQFGTEGPVEGSATVVDGTVYVGSSDGVVYAIDAASGAETAWEFDTGTGIEGGVAVERSPEGGAETVYAGNTGGAVFALDAATGEPRWEEPFVVRGQVRATPTFADGTVYVGTVEGIDGFVYAVDTETGEQRWQFEPERAVLGSPAIAGDSVYVTSRDQHVYAIDDESADQLWRYDTGRQLNNSPVVVGDTVYAASFNNSVVGLSLAGDERFAVETEGNVSASPAVAGGRLYVGNEDGNLYALEAGGEFEFGTGGDEEPGGEGGEDDDGTRSPLAEPETPPYAFLLLPASVVASLAVLAGGIYAVLRSDWAEQFSVNEAPIESLYEDEEESIPDYEERTETAAWSLVVGDVISRATERTKTAHENVIVTKYVDDTLDSPITAYEIESARDEAIRVTLTEELGEGGADALEEQPLNEGWTLGDDRLTFETTVDPDARVKTMVGRTDSRGIDELLDRPAVSVETVEAHQSGSE